jgi:hypothetical protein
VELARRIVLDCSIGLGMISTVQRRLASILIYYNFSCHSLYQIDDSYTVSNLALEAAASTY